MSAVSGCAGGAPESAAEATSAVVYDGSRLIDGTGVPAIEAARLVVDEGVVTAVGARDDIETPAGAAVVDLAGKTIMPALVNLHGHVGFQRGLTYDAANYTRENIVDHLNRYAYYGVGVIVSLGTDAGEVSIDIRRDQQAGTLGGARLFTAGRGLARPNAGPAPRHCGRPPTGLPAKRTGAGTCRSSPRRGFRSSRSGSTTAAAPSRSWMPRCTGRSSTKRMGTAST